MAPPRRFADYPGAKEATDISYNFEVDKNPILRGIPLAIGAAIVTRSSAVQRYLYSNAGFNKLSSLPSLDGERWRFDPTVIPLSNNPDSPPSPPTFDASLLEPKPVDLPGRWASFADYHALYKSGAATPLQVVEALLPLINRDLPNPTEYSKAWLDIHVDDVLEAARASTERWIAGKPLGILDGVPFGVKADCEVKGYVNTMGMKVDKQYAYFNSPATKSIWPVLKLEEAGAVMVGKMNQHEVGMDTTGCNAATGTPVNFYNKAYYPGGSSSGAGSTLGAGLVPLCVGTDAGGSIRIPTATAGCVALKPSHNRTMVMNSSMCIVGPMCANVADLTVAYRVMAQPDPEDPVTGLFAPSIPPSVDGKNHKKYLGLCRPWINRAGPEVRALFDKAVEHYTTTLGYEVVDIDLPFLHEGRVAHGAINLSEAADKAKARAWSSTKQGYTRPSRWTDLLAPANAITCSVGAQTTASDFLKFSQVRATIMGHLAFLFEKYGPGLLVASPICPDAGYPITQGDEAYGFTDANRLLRSMTYVWLSNMSGCPSATVPVGYVDPLPQNKGDGGRLPVGMLAMGMWGEEERLLEWASEGELYIRDKWPGGRLRPDGWVDVISKVKGAKPETTTTTK